MDGNKHLSWARPWLLKGSQLNEDEFSRHFNGKEPPPLGKGARQDAVHGPRMMSPPPHYPPRQQQSEELEQLTRQRMNSLSIKNPNHNLRMLSSPPDLRKQQNEERQQSIGLRTSPLTVQNSKCDPYEVSHPAPPYPGRQKSGEFPQAIRPAIDPPNVQPPQRDPRSFGPPQPGSPQNEQFERDLARRLNAFLRMPSPPPRSAWQQSENFEPNINLGISPAPDQQRDEDFNFNMEVRPGCSSPPRRMPKGLRTSGGKYALRAQSTADEQRRLEDEALAGDAEAKEAYLWCRKAQKQKDDNLRKRRDFGQPLLRKKHPFKVNLTTEEKRVMHSKARQGNRQALEHEEYLRNYKAQYRPSKKSGPHTAARTGPGSEIFASTRLATHIPFQPTANVPRSDTSQAKPANRFQSPPGARKAVSFLPTARTPDSGLPRGCSKPPVSSHSPGISGKKGKSEGKKSGFLGGIFGGKKR